MNGWENYIVEFDEELDTSGLNCPMPILKAKKAISSLSAGQILRVISTDPGSLKDFQAFAKQTGHELLEAREDNSIFFYLLKKRDS